MVPLLSYILHSCLTAVVYCTALYLDNGRSPLTVIARRQLTCYDMNGESSYGPCDTVPHFVKQSIPVEDTFIEFSLHTVEEFQTT